MASGFGIGDIHALAKIIHDLHDSIAGNAVQEIDHLAVVLDSSTQKLDLWISTWLGTQAVNSSQLEILWGNDGWEGVQSLLEEIKVTSQQFKPTEQHAPEAIPSRPWWRRNPLARPKPKVREESSSQVLGLALELDKRIDQLWAYSEVIFKSIHRLLLRDSTDHAVHEYDRSVADRIGAVNVYRAAQKSGSKCLLIPPVSIQQAEPVNKSNEPKTGKEKNQDPIYRLLIDVDDNKGEIEELRVANILPPTGESAELLPHKPNLQLFRDMHTNTSLRLSSKQADSVFLLLARSRLSIEECEFESFASYFDKEMKASVRKRSSTRLLSQRFELAFNLASSLFYFIGTPWLAGLSRTQRLVCVRRNGGPVSFGFRNETSSLEELIREDKESLFESNQLFRLGILLMEIAIGDEVIAEHGDLTDLEKPLVWATQQLPKVQMVAGTEYAKACEFCIKDHGSVDVHGRPEKYKYPAESGWNIYIQELLNDYNSEVLSRQLGQDAPSITLVDSQLEAQIAMRRMVNTILRDTIDDPQHEPLYKIYQGVGNSL